MKISWGFVNSLEAISAIFFTKLCTLRKKKTFALKSNFMVCVDTQERVGMLI